MPGYVIHVMALGKQIVTFAKIGITNNLSHIASDYPNHIPDQYLYRILNREYPQIDGCKKAQEAQRGHFEL